MMFNRLLDIQGRGQDWRYGFESPQHIDDILYYETKKGHIRSECKCDQEESRGQSTRMPLR